MIRLITTSIYIFAFLLLAGPATVMAQDSLSVAPAAIEAATPAPAEAVVEEVAAVLDSGNTAWILVATILVMLMTIPGLALFYGGLVRQKNILSIIMQCLLCVGLISILWVSFGYSWVFGTSLMESGSAWGAIIGGSDKLFFNGVTLDTLTVGNIPEILFALFQCMFAVITPALIIGAFAERIKFSGFLVFTVLWAILVYNPMAHWVWGGGWMQKMGAIDFAGGTVVHINAGVSALVMAIMLGKRKDYKPGRPTTPHNITFVFMGAALLWLGWFGFNAGSGLAADGLAANAFLVTHLATSVAAMVWLAIDWVLHKKPTAIGTCTGAVAGLVAITPAAGTVGVLGAFFIGAISSVLCFFMVAYVKPKFKYDDSLDAFGIHGFGGIVGAVLTGLLFSNAIFGGEATVGRQVLIQLKDVVTTLVYSGVATFVILKGVSVVCGGLRVDKDAEREGLDLAVHGERVE